MFGFESVKLENMLNLGKFLNKKVIFIFGIILILAAGGLFFWWQKDKIESFLEDKKLEKMVAPSKDYTIIENSGEKFIVNKKDGFKIKVPTEWEIELGNNMEILESDREVTLYSKDFSYRPPEGCSTKIQINRLQKTRIERDNGDFTMYPFEGAKEVKEIINSYKEAKPEEKESMQERGTEIISVDQREALQETTALRENIGKYITIKVPTENKVYIFESIQFSEKCNEEFNKFLETVLINPD